MKRVMLVRKSGEKMGPYEICDTLNPGWIKVSWGTPGYRNIAPDLIKILGFSIEEIDEPKTITKEQLESILMRFVKVNMIRTPLGFLEEEWPKL